MRQRTRVAARSTRAADTYIQPHLLAPFSRQPSAHVRFMVIMEMVKEFANGEAFIVQPHKAVRWIDPDVIGQPFNDSEELPKYVLRFIQDVAH